MDFFKKHIENKTIFRYWLSKYPDVEECMFGIILEAIPIPNDILIGLSEDGEPNYVEYYKLSEMDLAFSESDQGMDDMPSNVVPFIH